MCSSRESIAVVVEEVGCLGNVASAVVVVVEVADPKVMGGMPEGTVNVKSIACLLCSRTEGVCCKVFLCACLLRVLNECTNCLHKGVGFGVVCEEKKEESCEELAAECEKKKKKMKIGGTRHKGTAQKP